MEPFKTCFGEFEDEFDSLRTQEHCERRLEVELENKQLRGVYKNGIKPSTTQPKIDKMIRNWAERTQLEKERKELAEQLQMKEKELSKKIMQQKEQEKLEKVKMQRSVGRPSTVSKNKTYKRKAPDEDKSCKKGKITHYFSRARF